MDSKEKIMQIIRVRGPIIPADVAPQIGLSNLIASAHLSEMVSQGKLKISNIKIGGGSPLYYLSGQESQLDRFSKNLNDKNIKAYDYLKEQKVLRDSELTPLIRVALRDIKDFAKPLEVTLEGKTEIFWRYHLIDGAEAASMIRKMLGIETEDAAENKEKSPQENISSEPIPKETAETSQQQSDQTQTAEPQYVTRPSTEHTTNPTTEPITTLTANISTEPSIQTSTQLNTSQPEPHTQENTTPPRHHHHTHSTTSYSPNISHQTSQNFDSQHKASKDSQKTLADSDQSTRTQPTKKPTKRKSTQHNTSENQVTDPLLLWNETESEFIGTLKSFFKKKSIKIISADIKRKDSDIELIIEVKTALGISTYFARAKSKKTINDGDLSSLFIQSQTMKLPGMLIITGDMTKKAEKLQKEELKGIAVVKIE